MNLKKLSKNLLKKLAGTKLGKKYVPFRIRARLSGRLYKDGTPRKIKPLRYVREKHGETSFEYMAAKSCAESGDGEGVVLISRL